MYAEILDRFFRMADAAAAKHDLTKKKIIDECISEMHAIYLKFYKRKKEIDTGTIIPKNMIVGKTYNVCGMQVFEDMNGTRRWEVDKFGFDSEYEIIDYLIADHKNNFVRAKSAGRLEGLHQVERSMERLGIPGAYKTKIMNDLMETIRDTEDKNYKVRGAKKYE